MEERVRMTAQEAAGILRNTSVTPDINPDEQATWDKAILMGIAALLKDIPQKPQINQWMPTTCPAGCGYTFSKHIGDGYFVIAREPMRCPECGQLLDWEINR